MSSFQKTEKNTERPESNFLHEKKYEDEIKNEIIIFLIQKNIVNRNNLYFYSICREKSHNIIICRDSGVKFINDNVINGENVYANLDFYKYFQSPNSDIKEIVERKQNFYYDNDRRFEKIKYIIKDKIYLDFACGYGGVINKCSVPYVKDIIGIEIMETALSFLKKNYKYKFYNNIDIIENESIDVITIFQSFELLLDPMNYLKKFHNKLKKGGKMIIETSNANKALYTLYNNDGYKNFITSLRKIIYSESAIVCLLTSIGFKNINVEYQQRYNISNHLGWLSHNKSGNDIYEIDTKELNQEYKCALINKKISDTLFIICEK